MNPLKNWKKDKLKQPIDIGHSVIFNAPDSTGTRIGRVVGFTPKMIKICYGKTGQCNRYGKDILVVTQQIQYAKETFPEEFI